MPEEKLTDRSDAAGLYHKRAFASFEENVKGSLEPGKLADFVILSQDPTQCDPKKLRDIFVRGNDSGRTDSLPEIIKR